MTSTSPPKTLTADTLAEMLSARGLSQSALSFSAGVSQAYASQVLNSQRTPSAAWLNTVAMALSLPEEERIKLHRAAARDQGFEIEL